MKYFFVTKQPDVDDVEQMTIAQIEEAVAEGKVGVDWHATPTRGMNYPNLSSLGEVQWTKIASLLPPPKQAILDAVKPDHPLVNRYDSAYQSANFAVVLGIVIRVFGVLLGFGLAIFLTDGPKSLSNEQVFLVVVIAIVSGSFFFVIGTLVSGCGQIIRACVDTAVNTSPVLSEQQKASLTRR